MLLFIKSTVYCPAHFFIYFFCTFFFIFIFYSFYFFFSTSFIFLYLCIFFVFVFHIIALSMEQDLTNISLLVILCIIVYVANKNLESWILNLCFSIVQWMGAVRMRVQTQLIKTKSPDSDKTFSLEKAILRIEDSYFSWKQWFEVKDILMINLFITKTAFHLARC